MSDQEYTRTPGASGQPSQELPGSDDQTSITAQAVAAALKGDPEFANLLKNLSGAGAQSAKDKRMDKIENKQAIFEERLTRYEEYIQQGMTPAQAKRQMKVDDAVDAVERMGTSSTEVPHKPPVGNQAGDGAETEAQELLKEAGIAVDDPEYLELLRTTPANKLTGETATLIVRRVLRKPNPTGAVAITPSGGTGGSPDLMAQYKAALANIPEGNKEAVLRLRMEYRKKGLPI